MFARGHERISDTNSSQSNTSQTHMIPEAVVKELVNSLLVRSLSIHKNIAYVGWEDSRRRKLIRHLVLFNLQDPILHSSHTVDSMQKCKPWSFHRARLYHNATPTPMLCSGRREYHAGKKDFFYQILFFWRKLLTSGLTLGIRQMIGRGYAGPLGSVGFG